MNNNFDAIKPTRKTGNEKFHSSHKAMDFDLLAFWQWSVSDLVSNATRGRLAEFLVAKALGINVDVRDEWSAYDLETPSGIKIEVKSTAYLQTWWQPKFSAISFVVQKTREWNRVTNKQSAEVKRQADVYVFALLAHKDKSTIDPLDVDQWDFYVLPTRILDERKRSQHSITLNSLQKLTQPVAFDGLLQAVNQFSSDYKE
jgi:hypothetical protein